MKELILAFVIAVNVPCYVAGQVRAKRPVPAPLATGYHATVGENEAVFTFPLPPTQIYEWCPGVLQYAWTVKVNSDNQNYEFGYFMFTAMGASPCGRGNIQKLMREGQFSLFKQNDGAGSVITGVTGEGRFATYEDRYSDEFLAEKTDVSGFAGRNQITIKLSGPKAVRALFASRPRYVTLESQILEKQKSVSVPVIYASKIPHTGAAPVTAKTAKQAGTCMSKGQAEELVKQLVPNDEITYHLSGNLIYQRLSLADVRRENPMDYLFYEKGYLEMRDDGYSVLQKLTPRGQRLINQYGRENGIPDEADIPIATKTLVSVDKVTCAANKMRVDVTYQVLPTQNALNMLGTDIYRTKPFDRPWKVGVEFTNGDDTWSLRKNFSLYPSFQ
jgi:hypothetical protein